MTDAQASATTTDADPEWESRLDYWRRKLGRIHLGVEPVEDQLARYHRVTLALTLLPGALAVFFLSLFTAFRRPDIGAVLAGVLLGPIVAFAWIDYALLRRNVQRYLNELHAHEARRGALPKTKPPGPN